jgi:hypothetical protein
VYYLGFFVFFTMGFSFLCVHICERRAVIGAGSGAGIVVGSGAGIGAGSGAGIGPGWGLGLGATPLCLMQLCGHFCFISQNPSFAQSGHRVS